MRSMSPMLPVSVVVTVLNEIGDIGRVVPSLLAQSPSAAEVIVVDGGSTDGTWEWLLSAQTSAPLRAGCGHAPGGHSRRKLQPETLCGAGFAWPQRGYRRRQIEHYCHRRRWLHLRARLARQPDGARGGRPRRIRTRRDNTRPLRSHRVGCGLCPVLQHQACGG